MSSNNIRERLNYVKFSETDSAALGEAAPLIARMLPAVLDTFYADMRNYPNLVAMFGGVESMDRARKMQLEHWQRITEAKFDDSYVQSITRIGNRHNIIGLEPRWYIGGYSLIVTGLLEKIIKEKLKSPIFAMHREKVSACITSIVRAMLIDMDLAISTYLDAARNDRRNTMARLSSEFNTDVHQIATDLLSSSDVSSTNVQAVAAATEELAASIREISNQVTHTAASAAETSKIVEHTSQQVARLNDAVNKIGEVADMIRGIAERTNLLALNATIEAARAGEAGKGFAVVAAEVKNLASKTAEATKDIVSQIETIQAETQQTVSGIESIVGKINDVQERSTSVAAAIKEQQAATAEISRSVHQASSVATRTAEQTRTLKGKVDGFLQNLATDDNVGHKGT